jgi:phospholipase A1
MKDGVLPFVIYMDSFMLKFIILFSLVSLELAHCQTYEDMKNEYESLLEKKYILLPHKGTYLLPVSYNNNPNQDAYKNLENTPEHSERGKFTKNLEAEFQISFMILTNRNIFGTRFNTFLGYTHHSYWQIYNEKWSRPFRETNYTPEIFTRYIFDRPVDVLGMKLVAYDFGIVHQSNGQVQELSRSWNRVFSSASILTGNTRLNLTIWHRLKEDKNKDENPNIHRYRGYGEIDFIYKFDRVNAQLKLIPGTDHLSGEFALSTPWKEGLRFYTKLSHGYGLSLQDYDHENRRFGFGIILSDPFSKNSIK